MLLFMGAKIALTQQFSFIFSKMSEAGFIIRFRHVPVRGVSTARSTTIMEG